MNRKGNQAQLNGFQTPIMDQTQPANISLPGQFEPKLSPGAAPYFPRLEHEPVLPQVPVNHSAHKGHGKLPALKVNGPTCFNHPACCQSPQIVVRKDCVCECNHQSPSPHLCPNRHCPLVTHNPSHTSMSDIELTMSDEGQNTILHSASGRLSSHNSARRCYNITCSPIDNVKQPFFSPEPKTLHIEKCVDDFCDSADDSCGWHYCVLKYPQFIRWQADIRQVCLKRSSSNESFGFSNKAMMKSSKDNTEEMYVLVTKVKRKSKAARNGLAVGDLILSANGKPLQTLEMYHKIDFKGAPELKLHTQRPQQLLDKAADILKTLSKTKHDLMTPRIVEPMSPSMSPDQGTGTGMETQPFEAIPMSFIRSDSKPDITSHPLPQARLFLCGNCTLDFVHFMFGNLITISADSHASTYQISMEKLPDGSVKIDNSKAFSIMVEDRNNASINVEVVAVLNDKFFHNFCPWMFTPRSVFIMTFDTRKLALSNDSEMARLSSLANTILSHVPIQFDNVQLYGMKPPGDDATLEEVRTLFYTSLAASLPEPKMVSLSTADHKAIASVQENLFDLLNKISQMQTVLSITTSVIDRLITNPNAMVSKQELYCDLPERAMKSSDANHLFKCVIGELKATGNLIEVGRGMPTEDLKEYVIPGKFFESLVRLVQGMEKDLTASTVLPNLPGLLKDLDLLELVGRVTPCPPKVVASMKELSVVFPIRCNSRDSGFFEDTSLLLPYFVEDRDFHVDSDKFRQILTFECNSTVSISAFFHLLSDLSFQEPCVVAGIESQSVCRIYIDRMELILKLEKGKKKVNLLAHRDQKFQGKLWLKEFVKTSLSQHTPGRVVCIEPTEVMNENPVQGSSPSTNAVNQGQDLGGGDSVGAETPSCEDNASLMAQLPQIDTMVNNNNDDDEDFWQNLLQTEQTRVLHLPIDELRHIHEPLQNMYTHMSANKKWEEWAGYLGLTLQEVAVYRSLIESRHALPGHTFITTYIHETKCELGFILSSLIKFSKVDSHSFKLASQLWEAAWVAHAHWPSLSHPCNRK